MQSNFSRYSKVNLSGAICNYLEPRQMKLKNYETDEHRLCILVNGTLFHAENKKTYNLNVCQMTVLFELWTIILSLWTLKFISTGENVWSDCRFNYSRKICFMDTKRKSCIKNSKVDSQLFLTRQKTCLRQIVEDTEWKRKQIYCSIEQKMKT